MSSNKSHNTAKPGIDIDWTYSMTVCRQEQAREIQALWSEAKKWLSSLVNLTNSDAGRVSATK